MRIDACVRCGGPVVFDAVRVGISFMPSELEQLAKQCTDANVRQRILCALGTVDVAAERRARMDLESAGDGCPSCTVLEARLAIAEEQAVEALGALDDLTDHYEHCSCPHG